jgi:GNAT superfamily N-acetyltransferase
VLRTGDRPTFVSLGEGDDLLGVARGVVNDGWLGITAVTVDERFRRRGVGSALMRSLIDWGRGRGVHSIYLQVDQANAGALAMYARLGFTEHHRYHYLREG